MGEYGIGFFSLITIAFSLAVYSITIWQMENILELEKNSEAFIAKSKFCVITNYNLNNHLKHYNACAYNSFQQEKTKLFEYKELNVQN